MTEQEKHAIEEAVDKAMKEERIKGYKEGARGMKEFFIKLLRDNSDINDIQVSRLDKELTKALNESIEQVRKMFIKTKS